MESQDAGNVNVAGEGSATSGSQIAPETISGPASSEAQAGVSVNPKSSGEPVAEGQIAAGLVTVPERVPGPIDPESQKPKPPEPEVPPEEEVPPVEEPEPLPGDGTEPPAEEPPPAA